MKGVQTLINNPPPQTGLHIKEAKTVLFQKRKNILKMVVKLLITIFTEDTQPFSQKILNMISNSLDKNIDFFGKYREFILQLHVATDLLALPLPNKTKTLWPPEPRTPYFGNQEKI
jgi:hypothetical protein